MMYLITGGSSSGKSEYAEDIVVKWANKFPKSNLYYVATMYPYDMESQKRIARHRKMREKKNFTTIECYKNIEDIKLQLFNMGLKKSENIVLLECMSNLLANELYMNIDDLDKKENKRKDKIEDKILKAIKDLNNYVKHLVIVTNEIFSDGIIYDSNTEQYIRKLGYINCELGKIADSVVEVVYSTPIEKHRK